MTRDEMIDFLEINNIPTQGMNNSMIKFKVAELKLKIEQGDVFEVEDEVEDEEEESWIAAVASAPRRASVETAFDKIEAKAAEKAAEKAAKAKARQEAKQRQKELAKRLTAEMNARIEAERKEAEEAVYFEKGCAAAKRIFEFHPGATEISGFRKDEAGQIWFTGVEPPVLMEAP